VTCGKDSGEESIGYFQGLIEFFALVAGKGLSMKQVTRKSDHDKHVIEAVVRRFCPISRVGIYKLTNFRRTTISQITRELLAEGKLVEVGRSDNPLGRKQILLQLNEQYGFMVGIEFDDEKILAGVMDLHPTVQYLISEPTDLSRGGDGLLEQLKACAKRAIREAGIDPAKVLGLGIADPGLVDSRRGITIMSSTIDSWNDVPLRRIFEQEFEVPMVVESKTRAKTLAERMLGAGGMQENMIYLDYGAGIGAGVIVDGQLLYGQSCGAGEIGHTHISDDGPACKCGSIGCLEAIAGTAAVEGRIRKALAEGAMSQVLARAGGDPANITAWMVLEAAQAGDKMCGNIISELARNLGLALANVVNLFNPAVLVLDKRLEAGGDFLLGEVTRVVKSQALASFSEQMALRYSKLGEDAGILGLGLAVLEKRFEIPALRPPTFMMEDIEEEVATAQK
jgi:N-acetylglucosamine repressor